MRRTLWLLVGAGACLLTLLVVLLRLVESTSSNAATSSRPAPTPTRNDEVVAAPAVPGEHVEGAGTTASSRATARADKPVTRSPRAATEDTAPPPRADSENLHFGGTQLRAQTAALEPLIHKCLEAEVGAGRSPSGTAMLTYIVAKRGDKYLVEDTGVDDDKTTLQGDGLLACLRDTSRAMQFEGLPKQAEALTVTRRVSVEHGKLTENKHVGFSYLQ